MLSNKYEQYKNERQWDALRFVRGDYRAIFEESVWC